MKEYRLPDYKAAVCAAFARGNVGKARQLASSEDFDNIKDEAITLLKYIDEMEIHEITKAIKKMVQQVGPVQWQDDKVVKGVIIRHLILPGQVENSLKVLDWIGDTFAPGQVLVSLMRQYTPMPGLPAPFDRPITEEEYDSVLSWMFLNDLEGFTQEDSSANTAFIPDF